MKKAGNYEMLTKQLFMKFFCSVHDLLHIWFGCLSPCSNLSHKSQIFHASSYLHSFCTSTTLVAMSNLNINAGLPTEKHESVKVTVLGAGAFGTAMATIAARQDHKVIIYSRDANQVDHINNNHVNNRYLSEHKLPLNITATTDIATAAKDAVLIIHCIPAQVTPDFLQHKYM